MEQSFRTTRGEYSGVKKFGYNNDYTAEPNYQSYSVSLVGEERGYVLGVQDEQKKFREKMNKIIKNLKARGYPLAHIAEDTGLSLEEIKRICA